MYACTYFTLIYMYILLSLQGNPLGPQYFLLLNPDFLLQMIKDFLVFAPTQVSMCCDIPQTELKIREVV